MFFRSLLLLCLLISSVSHAGVVLLFDTPNEIETYSKILQDIIKLEVEKFNSSREAQDLQFIFDPSPYSAHLTLAYLSGDKTNTAQSFLDSNPKLKEKMAAFENRSSIDFTQNLKKPQLKFWTDKWPTKFEDKEKKNFFRVVMKLAPSGALQDFADQTDRDVQEVLPEYKRYFPFNPHVSLGRIMERDDKTNSDAHRALQEKIAQAICQSAEQGTGLNVGLDSTKPSTKIDQPYVIDNVKLNGNSGNLVQFNLKTSAETVTPAAAQSGLGRIQCFFDSKDPSPNN